MVFAVADLRYFVCKLDLYSMRLTTESVASPAIFSGPRRLNSLKTGHLGASRLTQVTEALLVPEPNPQHL
jgi:hypothetical protein